MDEQVMGNELISALNNIADAIRENAKANSDLASATMMLAMAYAGEIEEVETLGQSLSDAN